MQIHIQPLDWDSHFFGYTVGRISLEQSHLTPQLLSQIYQLSQDFKLIYVHASPVEDIKNSLEKIGCLYVGDKVDLVLDISKKSEAHNGFSPKATLQYGDITDRSELHKLALMSGIHSRYNIDPNFTNGEYNRLYIYWIDKSIAEAKSAPICLTKVDRKTVGFVSFSLLDTHSINIELVAVDPRYRGQGIAEDMLNKVMHYAKEHGYKEIRISTQSANIPALNLYAKVGFDVSSTLSTYHLWQEHAKNSLQ